MRPAISRCIARGCPHLQLVEIRPKSRPRWLAHAPTCLRHQCTIAGKAPNLVHTCPLDDAKEAGTGVL